MFPTQVAQKLFDWQNVGSKKDRVQLKTRSKLIVQNRKKAESHLPGIVLGPFSQAQEIFIFSGKQSPILSINNLDIFRNSQVADSINLTSSNLLRSDEAKNQNFIQVEQIKIEPQFSCVKKTGQHIDSPKKLSQLKKKNASLQKMEMPSACKPMQHSKSTFRVNSQDQQCLNRDPPVDDKQIVVLPPKPRKIVIEKSMLKLITAKYFVIICGKTLQTLYSRRATKQREMASLTKIMTCYLVCQLIEKYEMDPKTTMIKVNRQAAMQTGTTANLRAGDKLSILDMLYGMMLPSGNDAAYAIADFFGELIQQHGHEHDRQMAMKTFLSKMNEKAKELHLDQTNFANPHGLANSSNVQGIVFEQKKSSTAVNLGKLIYYAQQNELFNQIVRASSYRCRIENSFLKPEVREVIWDSTNKLEQLSRSDCLGVKTGFTPSAGPCYAANFQTSDQSKNLIIVLLRAKGLEERFTEAMHLYEYTKRKMP